MSVELRTRVFIICLSEGEYSRMESRIARVSALPTSVALVPARYRLALLVVSLTALFGMAHAASASANGSIAQQPLPAGCINDDGSSGCQDGQALGGAFDVLVSPDGKNAYAASTIANAIIVMDRNPSTGVLTQKSGSAGCIAEDPSAGPTTCQDGRGLDSARRLSISPDGKTLYGTAVTSGALTIFDRDTTTGELTQKSGAAGCVANSPTTGCGTGRALDGANASVVSADGEHVYVASQILQAR